MLEKHPRIYEEILREQGMFILAKRDRVDVTVYRYIKGWHKEEEDQLFSLTKDNRTRCTGLSCRKDILS